MTVHSSEISPRMGATPPPEQDQGARDLRDEVVALARSLPGGLRRLTVRDGDRAIEVEWATDAPGAGSSAPGAPAPAASATSDAGAEAAEAAGAVRSPSSAPSTRRRRPGPTRSSGSATRSSRVRPSGSSRR